MDLLPPRWADINDEVTELLAEIAKKSQTLERLHQKHVLPGFNDEEAKKAEESEIERLTQGITRGFHDCHKCIQRVEQMVREGRNAPGGMTSAEETMARNIQISLASRVQDASANFRKKQSAYLKSKFRSFTSIYQSKPLVGAVALSAGHMWDKLHQFHYTMYPIWMLDWQSLFFCSYIISNIE